MTESRPLAGIGLLMVAVTLFTVTDTIAKILVQGYPPLMVVWGRYAFHVLLMAALLAPRRGRKLVLTARPGLQILRGALLGMASMFFFTSLVHLPLADASAITQIAPILVTVLAVGWMGERAPAGTPFALIAGFAGVLLIVQPGSSVFSWWALLPLVNATCYAFYQLLTRKLAHVDDGLTTLFLGALVAMAVSSLVVPFHWVTPREPLDWLLFVAIGAFGALSHLMLVRAFHAAPASTLAPFSYFHMLVALSAGWLVFDQFPNGLALLGIGLVVTAGLVLALGPRLRTALR